MQFVLHRTRALASRFGHTIQFQRGVPVYVPPECREEAIAMGAVSTEPFDPGADETVVIPLTETEKASLVLGAVGVLVKRAQRDDFTAAGIPNSRVLSTLVGFTVDAAQRDAAWARHQVAESDA